MRWLGQQSLSDVDPCERHHVAAQRHHAVLNCEDKNQEQVDTDISAIGTFIPVSMVFGTAAPDTKPTA